MECLSWTLIATWKTGVSGYLALDVHCHVRNWAFEHVDSSVVYTRTHVLGQRLSLQQIALDLFLRS